MVGVTDVTQITDGKINCLIGWMPGSFVTFLFFEILLLGVIGRIQQQGTGGCNLGMMLCWGTGHPSYFPTWQTVLP